jgi:hypothetical protein
MLKTSYKIFDSEQEVEKPYESARVLPDGRVIGKTDEKVEDGMTAEEVLALIPKDEVKEHN